MKTRKHSEIKLSDPKMSGKSTPHGSKPDTDLEYPKKGFHPKKKKTKKRKLFADKKKKPKFEMRDPKTKAPTENTRITTTEK